MKKGQDRILNIRGPYRVIISIITIWAFLFNIAFAEMTWARTEIAQLRPLALEERRLPGKPSPAVTEPSKATRLFSAEPEKIIHVSSAELSKLKKAVESITPETAETVASEILRLGVPIPNDIRDAINAIREPMTATVQGERGDIRPQVEQDALRRLAGYMLHNNNQPRILSAIERQRAELMLRQSPLNDLRPAENAALSAI